MNAEFNWWLLIVGLVVGAGLVWYVLMDARRREVDVDTHERTREAAWLSATLTDEGWDVPPEAADRLLTLHRAYLEAPPPDVVPGDEDDEPPTVDVPSAEDDPEPAPVDPDAGPTTSELAGDDGVGLGA